MEQGIIASQLPHAFSLSFPSQAIFYDSALAAYYLPKLKNLKYVVVSVGLHRLHEGRQVGGRQHLYDALFLSPGADPITWLRRRFLILQIPPREALVAGLGSGPTLLESEQGFMPQPVCKAPDTALAVTRKRELLAYADSAEVAGNICRLKSIQTLCRQRGVVFVAVVPPMSGPYRSVQAHELGLLEQQLGAAGIDFVSFANSVPDSLFADADHLCEAGAKVYTQRLRSVLERSR
jgi:hypothetical protein